MSALKPLLTKGIYEVELKFIASLINRTQKSNQGAFKRMFHPSRKFDKELLAKVWLSWNGEPYTAVKGSSRCYEVFLSTIDEGKYAPDESYYKQSVALIILYKHLMIHAKTAEYGSAKAPVAAYTMAYLNYITLGNIDLLKIWELQEIPEQVTIALDNLCDRVKAELDVSARANSKSVVDNSKIKNVYEELKNRDLGFAKDSISDILNDN